MRVHFKSFILALTAHIVICSCKSTQQSSEVTVADFNHQLLLNWKKSFDGCNSGEVLSGNVHIGADVVRVNSAKKKKRKN